MARDGLLPRRLAKVSRAGVPVRTTLVTTLVVSTIASFLPLGDIVALANAGTPLAFSTVANGMLVMRRRAPLSRRGYRAPAAWLVATVAIAGYLHLLASPPAPHTSGFLAGTVRLFWAIYSFAGTAADKGRPGLSLLRKAGAAQTIRLPRLRLEEG